MCCSRGLEGMELRTWFWEVRHAPWAHEAWASPAQKPSWEPDQAQLGNRPGGRFLAASSRTIKAAVTEGEIFRKLANVYLSTIKYWQIFNFNSLEEYIYTKSYWTWFSLFSTRRHFTTLWGSLLYQLLLYSWGVKVLLNRILG